MAPLPSAHARNGTATAVHSAQQAGRMAVTLCRAVAVGYIVLERGSGAESKENDLIFWVLWLSRKLHVNPDEND